MFVRVCVWKLLLLKPGCRLVWLTDGGENSEGLDAGESEGQARQMENHIRVSYTKQDHHLTMPPLNPVRGCWGSNQASLSLVSQLW